MTTTQRTPPVLKTDSSDCDRCGKNFGIFTNKKNCFNCGLVVCESCSKYKTPLPQFNGHLRPVRCCAYCAHFLQVSKMDKASLLQLNIRTLKGYLTAYNISIHGMLEKQDLVEAIQSNRPLSEASETHFRENMPDTVENTTTFYEEFSNVGGMWQEADRGSMDNFFSKLFGNDGTPLSPRKSKTSQPGQPQGKTLAGSAANHPYASKPQSSGTQHERPRTQQYQQQQQQQQHTQQQQRQQQKPQASPHAQPTPQKPADGGPWNAQHQAQSSAGAYRSVYNPFPTTPPGTTNTSHGHSTPFPASMPMPMPNSPPYTPPQGTSYGYQQYPTSPPHSGPTPPFFGTYPKTQAGSNSHPYQPFPSQEQAYPQQNFGQQSYQAYPSYQQYPGHSNPTFPQGQPQPQQPYPQYPPQSQYQYQQQHQQQQQQQQHQHHQNPMPPMQPQPQPQPQPTQSSRPTSSYGSNGYSSSSYRPSTMYNAGDRPQASASSNDRPIRQPSPQHSPRLSPRPSPTPSPRSAERPTETNPPPQSQPRPQPSPQPTSQSTSTPTSRPSSTPGTSGFRSPQDRQEYAYQYSPAPEPNHARPQHEAPERPSQARPTHPDPGHTPSPPPSSSTSSSSSRPRVSSRGPQTSHSSAVLTLDEIISLDVDTSTLSIKVLKSLLDTNCVTYVGVVEKTDLVSRLDQLISETKSEQAAQKLKDDLEAAAAAARKESGKSAPASSSSTYGTDSSNNGDDNLCKICLDASLNCVMLNCNHMSTCMDCGKKIMDGPRTCPICREFIVRLLHVFRA